MEAGRTTWRGLAAAVLASAGCLLAAGCQSSPLNIFGDGSARFIGEETLSRIRPGETDVTWVKAVLGDPHKTAPLADSAEVIWRYNYQRISAQRENAFLVKKHAGKPENARHIYVQVANGVVTDWWRD